MFVTVDRFASISKNRFIDTAINYEWLTRAHRIRPDRSIRAHILLTYISISVRKSNVLQNVN